MELGPKQFGGIAVDPANSLKLAASTFSQWLSQPWGWGDRLFFSTDGGTTWTDIFAANRGVMDDNGFAWIQNHALHWAGSLIMDPVNSERVMVGSGNGIFGTDALTAAKSTWKAEGKGLEETVPLDIVTTSAGALMTGLADISGFVHADLAVSALYDSPASGNRNSVAEPGEAARHSGAGGVARAREFLPDVVLCDIGLPGTDGYDVARALRAERAPHCP